LWSDRPGHRGRVDRPDARKQADQAKPIPRAFFDKGIARKKSTRGKRKRAGLDLIHCDTDLDALKGCDPDHRSRIRNPTVKAEMTKRSKAVIPEDWQSLPPTPRTLPINRAGQERSSRAEQFIGIHFFSAGREKWHWSKSHQGCRNRPTVRLRKSLDYVRQNPQRRPSW